MLLGAALARDAFRKATAAKSSGLGFSKARWVSRRGLIVASFGCRVKIVESAVIAALVGAEVDVVITVRGAREGVGSISSFLQSKLVVIVPLAVY